MALHFKKKAVEDAELDVTSFMNLMIVLVPVLLFSLSFSQITVHEIKLPDLTQSSQSSEENPAKLEVMLYDKGIKVFYPSNVLLKSIPLLEIDGVKSFDFEQLSAVLKQVKVQLKDKREVLLLSQSSIDYQNLISAMDALKSYKTVVAASLVEVELFPEISLADASIK
jgi:biopolymer transport protein ExbD